MGLFLWLHICSDSSHWTSLTRVHLVSVRGRQRGAEGPAQSQSQAGCSATEPGTAHRHREGLVEGGRLLMTPGFTGNWTNHLPVLEGGNLREQNASCLDADGGGAGKYVCFFLRTNELRCDFRCSRVMLVGGDREERSAQMGGQYSWTRKHFPSASFVLMSSVLFSPKSRLDSLSLLGEKRCWSRSGATHSLRNGPCVGESCGFQLGCCWRLRVRSLFIILGDRRLSVALFLLLIVTPAFAFCPNSTRYFYSAVIQFSLTGSVSHSADLH